MTSLQRARDPDMCFFRFYSIGVSPMRGVNALLFAAVEDELREVP